MKIRRIIFILLFCLYIAAVAYLCFASPDNVPSLPESWLGLPADKVAHFLMFLPFPFLGFIAFESAGMTAWKRTLLLFGLIATGFAAAIGTEHIQAHTGYRSAESLDLVADTIGLTAGGLFTFIYISIRSRK